MGDTPEPRREDTNCMCGHEGPDGKGEHVGPPYCSLLKRKTCVHPGCNCKGFGTTEDAVRFIMDTRLGGP